jgi:hypothetical protein
MSAALRKINLFACNVPCNKFYLASFYLINENIVSYVKLMKVSLITSYKSYKKISGARFEVIAAVTEKYYHLICCVVW